MPMELEWVVRSPVNHTERWDVLFHLLCLSREMRECHFCIHLCCESVFVPLMSMVWQIYGSLALMIQDQAVVKRCLSSHRNVC